MRRIYFMLPDVETTRQVVNELLLNHVQENHIHVVASDTVPLEDLPSANDMQRSDLIPALEKGATVGGATGAIAGLVAVTVPPAGVILGGGAVLGLLVAGAGFGAWVAGMIGVGQPSSRLERFREAIDRGEVLVMVDVPRSRVEAVEEMVRRHHQEVHIEGTEPNMPNFP